MNIANPEDQRSNFIGRIQEQRQFKVVLASLLDHHRRWWELSNQFGPDFDPDHIPLDESYTRIFLLHGIGGIGNDLDRKRRVGVAQFPGKAYRDDDGKAGFAPIQ